jgi:hypothetical protein
MIAYFGWEEAVPEEADLVPLLRIDEDVPDGEIHVREGDDCYYLSTRTAERRVVKTLVTVWDAGTGEFIAEARGERTALSAELDSPARPYRASRTTGLA